MTKLNRFCKEFWNSECGATTTEYALMLVLIAGFLLFALTTLGNESGTFWGSTADALQTITQ